MVIVLVVRTLTRTLISTNVEEQPYSWVQLHGLLEPVTPTIQVYFQL